MDIAVNCFNLTAAFPKEEKFGLSLQITKCGVSIPSNIAEGSSRKSEKEYARFIEISLGSAYELYRYDIKSMSFSHTSCLSVLIPLARILI